MNLHLPQSIAAETELERLASVLRLIISPRENAPIIQMVQDTLTGAFRISNPKISIPEHVAMNLVGRLKRAVGSFVRTNENHTGMDVISSAFPLMNFNENVTIKEGKLVKGLLKKGAFNTPSKGVLHVLYNDFGPERCGQFINEIQSIVTKFNMFTGFSTGSSDLVSNAETTDFVAKTLAEGRRRVQEILTDVHAGRFVNISGRTDGDELENQINNTLKDISAKISARVMESLPKENRLVQMVDAGAKGSDLNITQMIALLGQQIIDGKRVQFTLQDRTLPHFTKFDDGIESRGFVESSFVHGLRPAEFFYHAMGGREGLIDTAVKSVTGDTEIVILEDGISKHTTIGNWIDRKLNINSDVVKNIENNNMEYLELEEGVYIPTVDTDGNMTWGLVTAVTRHDPGKVLYKVKTMSGREVIVTESQSLIVWDENEHKFIPKLTPEVTTDDYVPVCANLPTPPNTTTHIRVSDYLPTTDYLYGTDFEIAVREMKNTMDGRLHIPSGWWNSNNGVLFTLPYDSKARLQRVITRSNISNIQSGFVYPFTTNREHARIPDAIELNETNGIMFGLYLSEGNVDYSSGSLTITNNNTNIQSFVKNWFDSYGIVSRHQSKVNHIGGNTTTTTGYSVILVKLFTKLMGHGAPNKHVPNEAFNAPLEFVRGLLNGYFSGDGHVDHVSINVSSASSRLIQGISMLCNRLGVFGKVFTTQNKSNNLGTENILPAHRMTIRSHWASTFAEKMWFVDNIKNDILKNMSATKTHKNYQTVQDVVMDKIVEIEPIEPDNYPKMYDLTIPSTLNFGLANGLQVRDTSDTGYIQRRMMKTMEDMHVEYDATVRNNQGQIIQYRYGEDGIDSICVESQPIDLALLTLEEIYRRYALNPAELAPILTETITDAPDLVDEIIRDREMLVRDVFGFTNKDSILAPVHLKRLVDRYRNTYSTKTDLTPAYVVDELSKLIKEPYMISNKVFHCLLRFYLAPRRCMIEYRFSKEIFDEVIREIRFKYLKSRVHPGEMVGALAAQSIGEPTTQLTLNTFHSAGTVKAGATQGVPRIQELLSVSRNPKNPLNYVYLNPTISENEDQAIMMMREIQKTTLRDITKSIRIYYDPYPLTTDSVVQEDREILDMFQAFSVGKVDCASPWVMRLEFDKVEMASRNVIDMVAIQDAIANNLPILQCVYTDANADKLVMRIVFPTSVTNLLSLRFYEETILDVVIGGVEGVGRVYRREVKKELVLDSASNVYACRKQYVLDVEGTNLFDLLRFHDVDNTRTFSNDIHEVLEVFGIEAARQALYDEFSEVFAAAYVNYHHMSVLLDSMTYQGRLVSVDRFGMNKHDNGVLAKSSFEETSKILFNAAASAEFDAMKGISANIMFGQKPPCGTGLVEIMLDETKLPDGEEDMYVDYREQIKLRVEETKEDTGECKIEDITMW